MLFSFYWKYYHVYIRSDLYLLLPEACLKNDEGMDWLNYSTRGVHCVPANINLRPVVINIKPVVIVPCSIRIKYIFQLSDIKEAETLLC